MKVYKLGRKKANRDQLVKNLVSSLLMYERIITTKSKARLTQKNTEHIIANILKLDDVNGLKYALRVLGQKSKPAKKLIEVIKGQYKNSHGGYTRIINIGNRKGDNADMVILELTKKITDNQKSDDKSATAEKTTEKSIKKTDVVKDQNHEKNS